MVAKDKGKIEGIEWRQWVAYTILYAIGIGFVSGYTKTYLPEVLTTTLGPMDVQYFVWLLGLAIWGVITSRMFKKYEAS